MSGLPPPPPPGVPSSKAGFRGSSNFPAFSGPPPGMPPPVNYPPPLLPGWTEHRAPDGVTAYYYNSQTRESTYVRPAVPSYPPPGPPPTSAQALPTEKKKAKKEKAKEKLPIPGTTWVRVITNEGNVFYFEKEAKRSEWTVPEEIKDAVAELHLQEKERREEAKRQEGQKLEQERIEKLKELERMRSDLEDEKRRNREQLEGERKRKVEEGGDDAGRGKKTKVEEDDEHAAGPEDEEDEEAWMKAVAEEFAEKDAADKKNQDEEEERAKNAEAEAAKKVFAVPEKVNVSIEEGRALFKALLIEKDISPFAPWDQSLPLFINDPRYVLLASMKDRREVYEEYCREAGRAKRLNKTTTGTSEKKSSDPERDYKELLEREVTSTRARWDDFRKNWKKERKFYAFGRDDHQREKVFKQWLRDLGEKKRLAAQRAEEEFTTLLKESKGITISSSWSSVKRSLSSDPRYDAVGSSSLREELFNNYIKALSSDSAAAEPQRAGNQSAPAETKEEVAARKTAERKAKAEASLRDREAKVREDRLRMEKEMNKSKVGAGREEAERLFGSLLVDTIRDHEVSWQDASSALSSDPRFDHPALTLGNKQRLFHEHIARVASKRSGALHQLFETHTPGLDTPYEDVYSRIVDDPIVKRLGLQGGTLEDRWKAWLRTRETQARREFAEMLGENSFVEFWGKMRKKTLDEKALEVQEQDEWDEGEGMGEGGAADLTKLARQIDLGEIKSVLRRDKRYRLFDHVPEEREKWLRDYLENVEAASGSQTIHNIRPSR
ncbi:transcription elongation regulator 1 [Cryptococcus wingfieldii CBS 7118]|uniref:Transcription elongation regulator 1 n=1 Tax=Cryptococcus wingfieldii CBS 7118 TaxID=1295528 RepID=A0A1E3K6T7_9TREE|nr:transcription elongation regulator 1 [Cryptococcus wingfieldii CBS 7118]ODO08781.1 transcription elongation regulator 1 [Cryptococcus wingfieldii CBS 7118]